MQGIAAVVWPGSGRFRNIGPVFTRMAVAGCVAIEVAEAILTVRAGGSEQHAQEHHVGPCHPTTRTVLDVVTHFNRNVLN